MDLWIYLVYLLIHIFFFHIPRLCDVVATSLLKAVLQAKGNEIQTTNLKLLDEGVTAREGEKVPLSVKDHHAELESLGAKGNDAR